MFKFFSSFKNLVFFLMALIAVLFCFTYFYLFFTGKMFELQFVKDFFDGGKSLKDQIITENQPVIKKEIHSVHPKFAKRQLPADPLSPHVAKPSDQKIYSWVDKNGIKHFADYPPHDPSIAYTAEKSVVSRIQNEVHTPMIKDGNSVLIPVKLGFSNHVRSTWLTLDTGATTTTIHDTIAANLRLTNTKRTKSRIADGSVVDVHYGALDYIQVGPYRILNFGVLVLDYKGPFSLSNGLLGMNFLRNVDYKIDYQNNSITWSKK